MLRATAVRFQHTGPLLCTPHARPDAHAGATCSASPALCLPRNNTQPTPSHTPNSHQGHAAGRPPEPASRPGTRRMHQPACANWRPPPRPPRTAPCRGGGGVSGGACPRPRHPGDDTPRLSPTSSRRATRWRGGTSWRADRQRPDRGPRLASTRAHPHREPTRRGLGAHGHKGISPICWLQEIWPTWSLGR